MYVLLSSVAPQDLAFFQVRLEGGGCSARCPCRANMVIFGIEIVAVELICRLSR